MLAPLACAVLVCDAKLNFDDNAAYRHADLFAKRDISQEDPREVEASKEDLNYIGLDGTIGCMGASCTRVRSPRCRWAHRVLCPTRVQ